MKEIKQKPMYWYLLILTMASTIGLQSWQNLFNNFSLEIIGLNGLNIGVVQAIREIPGLLAMSTILIIIFIKEHHLSALSIILLGLGVALTGFFPTFTGLIVCTLLMSFGFHYYETTNQSLILQYFDEYQSPLVMGNQRSMTALVSIVIGLIILCISYFMSYKFMFAILGSIVIITGIWGLIYGFRYKQSEYQQKKIVFRKKYTIFYLLTLLSGARRQIFMVFSVFLLVKKFGFSIQEITILFIFNNIVNFFLAPFVAKAIKHFGERPILLTEYISLIIIFLSYVYCPYKWLVAILYVLDHIAFNGSMAIRTYFQKIADQKDISSGTAVSFTINHIAAVILPIVGGYLWIINPSLPFVIGAILSLFSLIASMFVKNYDKTY